MPSMARPTAWSKNPLQCKIKATDQICKDGATTDRLSPAQAAVLKSYTSPLHDRHGHLLYPGWAITNLSGPRGASYWSLGDDAPDLKDPESPWGADPNNAPRGWTFARQALSYWMGMGPRQPMLTLDVAPATGIAGDKLVAGGWTGPTVQPKQKIRRNSCRSSTRAAN
jgi:hypothetical protein